MHFYCSCASAKNFLTISGSLMNDLEVSSPGEFHRPYRVVRGGHPPLTPTERSVQISRTTLFEDRFTTQRAAIRSSPISITGFSSLCIEGRLLPLYGAYVSQERFNLRWPLPHVIGSPDLGVLSASLTP